LHRASLGGRIKVIRLLIEYGASVEVQDNDGRTPLDVMSEEQREEIIKLLLEHVPSKSALPYILLHVRVRSVKYNTILRATSKKTLTVDMSAAYGEYYTHGK
jgi:ankyrin repeat protein